MVVVVLLADTLPAPLAPGLLANSWRCAAEGLVVVPSVALRSSSTPPACGQSHRPSAKSCGAPVTRAEAPSASPFASTLDTSNHCACHVPSMVAANGLA